MWMRTCREYNASESSAKRADSAEVAETSHTAHNVSVATAISIMQPQDLNPE